MMDEKPNKYIQLPIPTYEEATSSRPASSQSRLGPEETSDDAERQGLLGRGSRNNDAPRHGNYVPPTVESERSSLDSLDGIDTGSDDGEVRREMEELEMEDPNSDNGSHRSLLTYRFKRLTSFTNPFPSISFPSFRRFVPSIPWPQIDWSSMEGSRVVIFGRLFGVIMIMGIVYILIASDLLTMGRGRMRGGMFDPESVRGFVQSRFRDPTHIERHLKHITQYPHMAGSEGSFVLGEYIAEVFKESKLEDVTMERFDVYLNYPRKDGRRVAIVEPEDKKWEAQLEEDHEETFVFHGHSKSGDVTGPLIYANYGSRKDFQTLKDLGISVQGAVVLVRYYGSEGDRALKVKAAEEAGAAGCIIYSDPSLEAPPNSPRYPEGRALPFDGVQRGAVSLMSWVVGDVLSPGWASTPADKHRLRPDESLGLVKIPSLPMSWRDAQHLLGALDGVGKKMGGDWAGWPDAQYWTGDQSSPKVNLKNLQDEETYQPIYNVLGRIPGWERDNKKVVVGNHRDAWCMGGADPGSGTAIMLHMVKTFGDLVTMGWQPLRTIEFASWDGEEYNLIGSTEHVENRLHDLRDNGIVYINVDMGAIGHDFNAAASPIFNEPLRQALARVGDPGSNKTLLEVWDEKQRSPSTLGAGSDFVAFQDMAGTSSIDLTFGGEQYPYHSCYDNFDWMDKFGDPTWEYSAALAQIWSLLILDFADNPLLPFDLGNYASSLDHYINDLGYDLETRLGEGSSFGNDVVKSKAGSFDLSPLRHAAKLLDSRARDIAMFDSHWVSVVFGSGGFESSLVTVQRIDRNNRVLHFESDLLDLTEGGGLVNRTQFKHVIYAPQTWSGYDGETFPSIRQWIAIGAWDKIQPEIQKVAAILVNAAKELNVLKREDGDTG